MIGLIFILINVLIGLAFLKLFKSPAAPPVVFSMVWTAGIFLHIIFSFTILPDILPISTPVLLLFTAGVIAFGFGSFLAHTAAVQKVTVDFVEITFKLRVLLILMVLVILPFYIKKAIDIVVASEIENFLMGLRWELNYGDADYGWYKYFILLSIIAYAACLIESIKKPTIPNVSLTIISFLISMAYVVLFTGRTFFLMIFVIYLFCKYLLSSNFSIKKLVAFLLLALIVFIGFGLFFNKGGNIEDSLADNLKSTSELTAIYLAGALSAFQYEVSNVLEIGFNGQNSLRFFYVIGEKLGFSLPQDFKTSLIQEFVYIPYETNVYTFYSPYVRDFGFLYPIFCLLLYGYIHQYTFRKAKATLNPRMIIYSALLMYPVVMSIFSDQYLSLLSTWLQIIVIVETLWVLNRFFIVNKSGDLPTTIHLPESNLNNEKTP